MKIATVALATLVAASAFAQSAEFDDPAQAEGANPFNAVVKLEVSMARPNIYRPWATVTGGSSGSGVVIGNGRILTCAHCVVNASYISVRKHFEDSVYQGTVLYVDNDADLALVSVGDPKFMADIIPMEIGRTPQVQDEVVAVGYPIGGSDISFTRGIVSRIEDISYSHSLQTLLGIQVDAAINPGNSGGPVLDMTNGQVAGIAFQGDSSDGAQALGYIIPPDIINHFLDDIKDNRVDGFCSLGFDVECLENPSKRRYYKMGSNQTGVVVVNVSPALGDDGIKVGDVILEIDGYKVSNIGRVRLAGGEPRSLYYPLYTRQLGGTVPVKVLRNGMVVAVSIKIISEDFRCRKWMYDTTPDYFVCGGLVFTTLSYDYLLSSGIECREKPVTPKNFPDEECVVLSEVFAENGMEGYQFMGNLLVKTVNGEKVRNLRHLVELVEKCTDGFVCFGLDAGNDWNTTIILDAKEMKAATARVLKRYQIPADRSADLVAKPAK